MATTRATWGVITLQSYTATDIADVTAAVNTTGKYEGLMIWDSVNKRMLRAAGALPADAWDVVDGSVQVTPT